MPEQIERYGWIIAAVFCVPLVAGIAILLSDRLRDPAPLEINTPAQAPADARVYITGAVQNPGVYAVEDGDRWIDALAKAGGAARDADLTAINLARRALDEDQIVVPRLGQTDVAGASQQPLLNINTAAEADLVSLRGIGEVRAKSIVQSRTQDGPFSSIDDLVTRKLVPQSVLEEIASLITVNP